MTLAIDIRNWLSFANSGAVWSAYNTYNGQIVKESRGEITLSSKHGFDVKKSSITLRESTFSFGGKKNLHSLSGEFLLDIAARIDSFYMTTKYRNVLKDTNWGKLFQVEDRAVNYIKGTELKTPSEPTMPCYSCGLVLPVGHITIDHHKPQVGGQHQAVIKCLRNIGYNLTHDPGKGGVANAYYFNNFQALPTKSAPPPLPTQSNGSEMDFTIDVVDNRKPERYTLSDRGITFLSVAVAASGLDELIARSMHSVFNLKPYCAKCNIKKSNQITDLSWIND